MRYPYGTREHPEEPGPGSVAAPLIRSSTWQVADTEAARELGERRRHDGFYARYGHPNGARFEAGVARLEGADGAVAFASGMAAIHAVFCALVGSGDRVLVAERVYGGTEGLCARDLTRFGIHVERFDALDPASLRDALRTPARLVWIESPVNPTIRLVDLPALAQIARDAGAISACDATFAPPPLQRTLEAGIDLVIHSATKFLGGHSDVLAGVVAGGHELLGRIEGFRVRTGAILGADAAWLLERSLQTHRLRVTAQAAAAERIARELAGDVGLDRPIRAVLHPSLPDHPDHALMRSTGVTGCPVLALEMAGGLTGAARFHDALQLVVRAPSLGGVESLVSLPVLSSHAHVAAAERARLGVADGLVRISVGLEGVEQIVEDLRRAAAASVE